MSRIRIISRDCRVMEKINEALEIGRNSDYDPNNQGIFEKKCQDSMKAICNVMNFLPIFEIFPFIQNFPHPKDKTRWIIGMLSATSQGFDIEEIKNHNSQDIDEYVIYASASYNCSSLNLTNGNREFFYEKCTWQAAISLMGENRKHKSLHVMVKSFLLPLIAKHYNYLIHCTSGNITFSDL